MSFVNQLISYIIKIVVLYNTLWLNYNIIYSMFDSFTPILLPMRISAVFIFKFVFFYLQWLLIVKVGKSPSFSKTDSSPYFRRTQHKNTLKTPKLCLSLVISATRNFVVVRQKRYSGSALRVPYSVCECTPHAAPFWDPCEVDFPLTYCEEVKVILFN